MHWPMACPSVGELRIAENGVEVAHKSRGTMFPTDDEGYFCSDNKTHFVETWNAMELLVDEG